MGVTQSILKLFQPPPLLYKPWRKINWGDNESALQHVRDYKPQTEGQQLRILLYGPVGAGKSSFINSVQSVLHGRMYTQALADNTFHGCFAKQYTTYKIQKRGSETLYLFVLNDIMGLDPHRGVLVEDIKLAMMGHVREGYTFNPDTQLSDDTSHSFYNKDPTNNDKVHVLVCVIPVNTVLHIRAETMQKIRNIRIEASKLNIPQVAILTKIDEACTEIKKALKNVYKSKYLKEKMEEFSADVGIPMNCIFPVKNYSSEINLSSDADSLILSALTNIINFGDDYINFHKNQSEVLGRAAKNIEVTDTSHNFYNKDPTNNDKVHVLVCVIPVNTVLHIRAETMQKIRNIRIEASKLNIPQVAILTKIDEACTEIKKALKNVYRSKYLKEKMEEFSADVGIPMNCIFPVKNYSSEINLSSDADSLILSALTNIINFGDDYINFHKNQSECSDTSMSTHDCI